MKADNDQRGCDAYAFVTEASGVPREATKYEPAALELMVHGRIP
jgi:hypothetical protein